MEDEEVVCPAGYFPIMTVHQAKGLDFVFVGNLGGSVSSSNAHQLEQDLRPFRFNPPVVTHPISASQWHDDIRQQLRRVLASEVCLGSGSHGWATSKDGLRDRLVRLQPLSLRLPTISQVCTESVERLI
jgi:hypothetical protein